MEFITYFIRVYLFNPFNPCNHLFLGWMSLHTNS